MKNGEKSKRTPGLSKKGWLLDVCYLLNKKGAQYLVIGGWACNLHGLIRATTDIDLLIPKDLENTEKVLEALCGLTFGIASELDAEEVVKKQWTIIGDTPRVDLLTVAHKVKYEKAKTKSLVAKIDQITVPYVDYETLIATKQTGRLQDQADIERLTQIVKTGKRKK